ncbi:MAG: metallophosphoesterase [Thermaerobacter sp.]
MRILVISDSHIPQMAPDLPAAVYEAAEQADAILHAGDITDLWVCRALERFAPTHAVHGNVDGPETAAALPARQVLDLAGVRVGLTHGHLGDAATTPERAFNAFAGEPVQVVVFGHSHQALIEERGGVLLLNPGSVSDRRQALGRSFAWLYVEDGRVRAELVRLDP